MLGFLDSNLPSDCDELWYRPCSLWHCGYFQPNDRFDYTTNGHLSVCLHTISKVGIAAISKQVIPPIPTEVVVLFFITFVPKCVSSYRSYSATRENNVCIWCCCHWFLSWAVGFPLDQKGFLEITIRHAEVSKFVLYARRQQWSAAWGIELGRSSTPTSCWCMPLQAECDDRWRYWWAKACLLSPLGRKSFRHGLGSGMPAAFVGFQWCCRRTTVSSLKHF